MKICDICGNINPKFNNFCFHCGNENYRRNTCPTCSYLNEETSEECFNCGTILEPVKIRDLDFLVENYDFYSSLIENYDFNSEKYNGFLDEIFLSVNNHINKGNSIKEIILNFTSNFAECIPKSRSSYFGYCEGDVLYYDERLNEAIQTVTIIHELAHVILYKLILYLSCDIFNIKPSSTIKGFAWSFLNFNIFQLLNEYVANSVESSFAPYNYHNYGSFWDIYEESDIDDDELEVLFLLGNAIVDHIVIRLNDFIDPQLKKQIEAEFINGKLNQNPNPPPCDKMDKLETEKICEIFINFLKVYYKKLANPERESDIVLIEELKHSIEKFKIKNN